MDALSLYSQIKENLVSKEGTCKNYYEALEAFEEPWEEKSEFTTAAGYANLVCNLSLEQINNILWLTIEVPGGSDLDKAFRFREIPTRIDLKGPVQELHKPVREEGWRAKITREKWLTMTDIFREFRKSQRLIPGLVLLRETRLVDGFHRLPLYTEGKLALLYPDMEGCYWLSHIDISEPIDVDRRYGIDSEWSIKREIEWLRQFKGDREVSIYFGYENIDIHNRNTVIWCALAQQISDIYVINLIANLPRLFNSDFIEYINRCVDEYARFKIFLKNTEDLDIHTNVEHAKKAFDALMIFLGTDEELFFDKLGSIRDKSAIKINYKNIRQCMITMCGKDSLLNGGNEPLSLLGAFLYLLGAIATKNKVCFPGAIGFKSYIRHSESIRSEIILPYQSKERCHATIKAMFEMFLRLTWDEVENRCVLKKVLISDMQLELRLEIKATVARPTRQTALQDSIGHCLAGMHKGHTSSAIKNFFQNSYICDTKVRNSQCFFPPACRIELGYKNGETVFRLIKMIQGDNTHWT